MGPGPGIAARLLGGPHTGTGEAGKRDPECTGLDRPTENLAWAFDFLSEKVGNWLDAFIKDLLCARQ